MDLERTGGCGCGAVRYRAELIDETLVACHCAQCRRQSGHYWVSAHALRERFAVEQDEGLVWRRSSDRAERGFCGRCGAALFWRGDGGGHVSVSAGSLDDPSGLRLVAEIYTEGRPDYYRLCSGAPEHGGWPGRRPSGATPI